MTAKPENLPRGTLYTDPHNGKRYLVPKGYGTTVTQYAAGARVWFDGSSDKPSYKTCFKTRARLNGWLKMMGFK